MDEDFRPLRALRQNEVKTFYLPLVGGFLDTADLYWKNIHGDFFLDFFPASDIRSETIGSNNIDCLDICMIVQTEDLDARDNMTHDKFYQNTISSSRYLDVIPLTFYNETLVANQEKKLELDSVNGNVAGFVAYVKKSGATNFGDGRHEYVSLGKNATLDLLDSGSQSLWGNGVAIPAEYLKNELWVNHFQNDYNKKKNFYLMPFGASMKSAFHGVVDGYVKMAGERNYIAIKPAATGINKRQFQLIFSQKETHVTYDANNFVHILYEIDAAGHIRLGFGGYTTGIIELTNNADVASSVKAQLERLPSFQNFNGTRLTCTISNVVTNWNDRVANMGTKGRWSCVITIDQPVDFPNDERIECVESDCMYFNRFSDGLAENVLNWNVQTRHMDCIVADYGSSWKEGFESGNYDITIYALIYKHIHNYKGKLTVEQD